MIATKETYAARRAEVARALKARGIAAARFDDFEHARSPSLRYLSGQPGDAFLVITSEGASALVPWDVNMAQKMASVDRIFPYNDYGRKAETALRAVLKELGIAEGEKVEVPETMTYPTFVEHVGNLEEWDLVCEREGIGAKVLGMRARKDPAELELYRRASGLTDSLMDSIEAGVKSGRLTTELDVALFIEKECRAAGAEGTGFDTIAAGPGRSFGIHAFPSYGSGGFAGKGLSILDFGIKLDGYTTDVTMTFARGPLGAAREKMLELVAGAHALGVKACAPGIAARDVALAVDAFFAEAGYKMPHALGHGVGLEAHEAPGINLREGNNAVLEPGNIVTIEPGLYDPELGGARLENDVLITADGAEVLTHSRIVRL